MTLKKVFLFLTTLFLTVTVHGHARFLLGGNTPPRNNSTGLKSGPCGGITKNMNPTIEFQTGQTITLQWEETVNHPGRFEFSLSTANDQNFQLLLTVQDTQDDQNTPHRYSAELKLPDGVTCQSCTLQMIQQMTENPNNPRPYFSCSDIRIVDRDNPTPMNPVDEEKNDNSPVPDCH